MFQRCKLLGLLTPYQVELLKTLFELKARSPEALWKPRDLGAYRSSHHHKTLKTLGDQGLVEQHELPSAGARPRYAYRISEQGVKAWQEFVNLSNVTVLAVPGRSRDRDRATRTMALAAA